MCLTDEKRWLLYNKEISFKKWHSTGNSLSSNLTSDVQSTSVVLPVQSRDFVEVEPVGVIKKRSAGLKEVLWLIQVVQPAVRTRRTLKLHFWLFCLWFRKSPLWRIIRFVLFRISIIFIAVWESPACAVWHLFLLPLPSHRGAAFRLDWIHLVPRSWLSGLRADGEGKLWSSGRFCFYQCRRGRPIRAAIGLGSLTGLGCCGPRRRKILIIVIITAGDGPLAMLTVLRHAWKKTESSRVRKGVNVSQRLLKTCSKENNCCKIFGHSILVIIVNIEKVVKTHLQWKKTFNQIFTKCTTNLNTSGRLMSK